MVGDGASRACRAAAPFHDTERNGSSLSHTDAALNVLAHEFMLARGYGTPQVYSSFTFTDHDQSPPSDAGGFVADTACGKGWTCVHRVRGVRNMVAWHNRVGRAPVANWYDDGADLIAFSRGRRGWIAINAGAAPRTRTFMTGLPQGTYCDVIHSSGRPGRCRRAAVTVDRRGRARVEVPATDAVALRG